MSEFPPIPDNSGQLPSMPPPPPPVGMQPPPGYVAYGGQNQGAFGTFQKIGGVSKALGYVMMAVIAIQVLSTLVSLSLRGKVSDFLNERTSTTSIDGALGLLAIVAIVAGAVMLAAVVLTMIWMFRMAKNQQILGRSGRWVPGWAIGGWFLPPCILYIIPYLMMRDLWKSSEPESGPNWAQNAIAPIVHIWWVLYGLVPLLFISVSFNGFKAGQTIDDAARNFDDSFTRSVLNSVVQIAAAVAYLLLVRQLSQRHMRTTQEAA
jgi:hypothetical protein